MSTDTNLYTIAKHSEFCIMSLIKCKCHLSTLLIFYSGKFKGKQTTFLFMFSKEVPDLNIFPHILTRNIYVYTHNHTHFYFHKHTIERLCVKASIRHTVLFYLLEKYDSSITHLVAYISVDHRFVKIKNISKYGEVSPYPSLLFLKFNWD